MKIRINFIFNDFLNKKFHKPKDSLKEKEKENSENYTFSYK